MISALYWDNGSHHLNGSRFRFFPRKAIQFLQHLPEKEGGQQQQAKVTLAHYLAERLVLPLPTRLITSVALGSLFSKPGRSCRISTYSFAIRTNLEGNTTVLLYVIHSHYVKFSPSVRHSPSVLSIGLLDQLLSGRPSLGCQALLHPDPCNTRHAWCLVEETPLRRESLCAKSPG